MTVTADDVRRLLDCQDDDAVLVLIEGRVDIATPAQLDSPEYRGALQIATRADVLQRAGGPTPSENELAQRADELDTEVRNLGA
ncbi:hypothetical protein A5647_22710 [Mycobacterium sp. 1100029.7]|nr:hypothetical protein A5647_22710 [Mycobacterium sp. 1100029.7]